MRRTKDRYQSKWRAILAECDDGQRTARQVAAEVGCSESAVWYWRKIRQVVAEQAREEKKKARSTGVQCTRCKLFGEEQNPIGQSGLCLWCRLTIRGVNLLAWYESGAAAEYVERYRRQREDEKVCAGEAEGLHV